MIRAAVFDVDGTLLDSMPIWENAAAVFLAKYGIEAEAGLGRRLYPLSMQEGAAYLQEKYRLSMSSDKIIAGVGAVVSDFYAAEAPLKPNAAAFLNALREKSIPMAIATSNERSAVEAAFRRLGILQYFTEIFTCSEIGAGKTKPDIYQRAAEALQAAPGCTWVFEDAYYAAKSAHDAGFRVAGVYDASSAEESELLRAVSDIYIEDFGDFAGFYREAQREETK